MLLRNLAEHGDLPLDRERRLRRSNREDLPRRITHFREALEPGLTVTAVGTDVGSCATSQLMTVIVMTG